MTISSRMIQKHPHSHVFNLQSKKNPTKIIISKSTHNTSQKTKIYYSKTLSHVIPAILPLHGGWQNL